MGAGRSRRSKEVAALRACLAVVAAVGVSPTITPIASARVPRAGASATGVGSSCADPESVTLGYDSTHNLAETPGYRIKWLGGFGPSFTGSLVWYAPPGEIICSTRIQLANGSVVPPTYLFPYPTPTPNGGQYDELAEPASHVSTITLTAAKSPVPAGKSCTFPIESSLGDTIQHTGPRPDILVKLIEVSPASVRLKLTPRKPNLVLCPKADFSVWLTDAQGNPVRRLNFYVPVKPHGGLTPVITIPPGTNYRPGVEATDPAMTEAWAFARMAPGTSHKARAKKARAARTAAPPAAHPASNPTTVSQCKKRYKPGSKPRAACIKRVKRPGSSCEHPLMSLQTSYGPGGDKADFTVELGKYDNEALPFVPVQVNAIVTIHNPRVVICPKVKIIDFHPGSSGTPPHYYAMVGPEGGSSSTITIPFGIFTPTAYARLK